ncbi:MAG TPA: NAD(P)-dependent alcohol dehydrogenase, partial [Acidimicrobiales bacterium]|nr:NAD(P)-dependent alcohol dehydrogenase [Acidimicrobiales bacterium]
MALGKPYLMRPSTGWTRPKRTTRGVDVAGVVEKVGAGVTRFQVGDEVFGLGSGSFAEYVSADETELVRKPATLSFEEAAALPVAGCTALEALRRPGPFEPGRTVLVNGAAGGVGTFTVQLAKAWGATVTGVCSTAKVELVRSLGADYLVDYTKQDFCRTGATYDLVIDAVGNRSFRDLRRAMSPSGQLVLVGGGGGPLLGPIRQMIRSKFVGPFVSQTINVVMAKVNVDNLLELARLHEEGKLRAPIERTCSLPDTPAEVHRLYAGDARGKTVVLVNA